MKIKFLESHQKLADDISISELYDACDLAIPAVLTFNLLEAAISLGNKLGNKRVYVVYANEANGQTAFYFIGTDAVQIAKKLKNLEKY